MKIIISPAKTMNVERDIHDIRFLPYFLDETKILMDEIRKLSFDESKALWKCNDKLAMLNFKRFSQMNLEENLTPAVFSYEGLQYKNMGPGVFSDAALEYIEKHLRILSGFYGVLRPFDGVTPYRLEMQAKLGVGEYRDLYEFWGRKIYEFIKRECREEFCGKDKCFTILNLASKEYSRAVEKYIGADCRFVTVDFGQLSGGKVRQKATFAKMARGDMVRFLAEGNITDIEGIKDYDGFGFRFSEEFSRGERMVFVRTD